MDSKVYCDAWFDVGARTEKQTVNKLTLIQEKNCHQLALVKIRRPDTDTSNIYRAGAPVTLSWGRKGTMENTFYGYCGDPQSQYDRAQTTSHWQTMEIPVLGASLVLKQPFTYTWEGYTVEQIVRDIAQSAMFSVDITGADMVWPQFSNPGKSGWEVLRQLAKAMGLVVYAHNTDLMFFDPLTLIKRKQGVSPTFHTQKIGIPDTIVSFEAKGGDLVPIEGRRKANRSLFSVDPISASVIQATGTPPWGELASRSSPAMLDYLEHEVAPTTEWAQTLVDGAQQRNRFSIRADACLSGDSRVSPAAGVILRGVNPKHSGLWTVEKVTHNLELARYTMDVVLGRDSTVDMGSLVTNDRRVVRQRLDPFDNPVDLQRPGTLLANGQWRSAWMPKKVVNG